MPVIPAPWEAEVGRSPKIKSSKPAWPTWWNPVSTNNTKISQMWWHTPVIPATQGGWGTKIAWTQETEVAVSWDRATVLQPGWQSNSVSKKKNLSGKKITEIYYFICRLLRSLKSCCYRASLNHKRSEFILFYEKHQLKILIYILKLFMF